MSIAFVAFKEGDASSFCKTDSAFANISRSDAGISSSSFWSTSICCALSLESGIEAGSFNNCVSSVADKSLLGDRAGDS